MPKKIDPLNRKHYGALSISLTVVKLTDAVKFYQQAFGFTKRGILKGPDGNPMHAELVLRGTALLLGPESKERKQLGPNTMGGSPASLYLLTENVDKVVAKAVKLGAKAQGVVAEMFWGDRCGTVIDPEGYTWMIATHVAELTPQQMKKRMMQQMSGQTATAASQ